MHECIKQKTGYSGDVVPFILMKVAQWLAYVGNSELSVSLMILFLVINFLLLVTV